MAPREDTRLSTHEVAERPHSVRGAVERLYDVFSRYPPGSDFCTYCYTDEEIRYITTTAVRRIDEDTARRLLWETGDHWESQDLYRHYLPRLLDVLAPPDSCEDNYPAHLFEVLQYLDFSGWPLVEREAVISFLEAVTPYIRHVISDEWDNSLKGLLALNTWTTRAENRIDLPASAESLRKILEWGRLSSSSPYTHHELAAWCAEIGEDERARNDQSGTTLVLKIAADVEEGWKYWLAREYGIEKLGHIDWGSVRMPLEWFDAWLSELDRGGSAEVRFRSCILLLFVLVSVIIGAAVTIRLLFTP